MSELETLLKSLSNIDNQCRSKIENVKKSSNDVSMETSQLDVVRKRFETKLKEEGSERASRKRRARDRLKEEDELLEKITARTIFIADWNNSGLVNIGVNGDEDAFSNKEKRHDGDCAATIVSNFEHSIVWALAHLFSKARGAVWPRTAVNAPITPHLSIILHASQFESNVRSTCFGVRARSAS